ncbi:MAG: ImmA/IrrE family metallo-endopeptidase [Alicyclobacillus sp.]|nr:ImmA/IrrE family metallo-endopeptidase [Alicyclobacillus sp.]
MTNLARLVHTKLLSLLNPSEPEDIDLFRLCSILRIEVLFYPRGSELTGTQSYPVIILDSRNSDVGQRIDLAHELCHFTAHAGNQLFLPETFTELQERQADTMAAELLVPTDMLRRVLGNGGLPQSEAEAVPYLARRFRVTEDFIRRRLNDMQRQEYAMQLDKQFMLVRESGPQWGRDFDHVATAGGVEYFFRGGRVVFARKRADI